MSLGGTDVYGDHEQRALLFMLNGSPGDYDGCCTSPIMHLGKPSSRLHERDLILTSVSPRFHRPVEKEDVGHMRYMIGRGEELREQPSGNHGKVYCASVNHIDGGGRKGVYEIEDHSSSHWPLQIVLARVMRSLLAANSRSLSWWSITRHSAERENPPNGQLRHGNIINESGQSCESQ